MFGGFRFSRIKYGENFAISKYLEINYTGIMTDENLLSIPSKP
jgi:hypothetical protein